MEETKMSSISATTTRRSRRRLALWLAFGAIGLSMGAMWATGFATFNGGSNGAAVVSPIVVPGSPTEAVNPLAGDVHAGSTWTPTWAGDWGSTAATEFFKIDLTGASTPASQTYDVAMLLTNGAALTTAANAGTGWQTLQLNAELVKDTGGTCAASDFTNADPAGAYRLFAFDSEDSAVYWNAADGDVPNGLAGGTTYCVGIAAATGPYSDGSGTFLRAEDASNLPTTYPNFVLTVNRVS
jgi:hypothetical protein